MSMSAGFPTDGDSIGPYRIVRRIGGGGMGVVYEAAEETLSRHVALKVISPHLAESDDFRARFTREARALASLDSPNVVHVYAHGEADGRLYIATQLIPDGDLGSMLQGYGAPPIRVALDLMGQVANGLADAHAAGLIHRDIKPANVLLRRRDDVMTAYLGDFGIARLLGAEHTRSQTGTIGTPSYMAPELHTGGTAGVATDVYSLGCLLWATLSGRAPYTGTTEYQIVTAHLEQPIPQLLGDRPLMTEVNRILRTAMAKDPAERYGSAAQLRDDLRRATSLPDDGSPGPVGGAPSSRTRKRLGLIAAGVAVLIALTVGSIAYAASTDDDEPPGSDPTPSTSPSATAPTSPTTGSSPTGAPEGDEAIAIASFATALEDAGVVTRKQSQCVAQDVVQSVGLDQMIEDGFFDENLDFVDQDLGPYPEIKSALETATLGCVATQS